jgi:hypothetical protein
MGFRNRLASLKDKIHGLGNRYWLTGIEAPSQVGTFKILHHHEWSTQRQHTNIQNARDVLILNSRSGPSFAPESFYDVNVSEHFRQQKFDCDSFP